MFADFVNSKIESANKLIFLLFADCSKSVKNPPLSLKKKKAFPRNQPLDMHETAPRTFLSKAFTSGTTNYTRWG